MIICTKNMDYRLGTQYQFVQNQYLLQPAGAAVVVALLCIQENNRGMCHLNISQKYALICQPIKKSHRLSLDSSCEVACLREQIQKSQEEIKERKGDRLHSQTLPHADVEEEDEAMFSADPSRFVTDPEFCYQEFARREEDHFQVFRVQDYSWEDHGFSLVNRLYSDIGHLLDERFRSVASLPFPHSPDLKRAIWNYIHCIYGIRYDDYDYGEVSRLLERGLKLYIKAVACYPDSSKTPLCPLSWAPVKASDKVHVNLLVMEARLQAELLYALRAITQYMIA
ncbi:sestrin-3-like [Sinocyclocheilus grahami]|uniref:sestrin-3-like n=1 Tax=Sinocyclocheilus grahami TaxID=75366 RepID=UPI0007ACB805|nr:PREDICTED: sestrin-3-like [Sinocyclocheilus grahami]